MNAAREQGSASHEAGPGALAVKGAGERAGPPATPTYHPVKLEAEYGCVDWYQYRVQPRDDDTRH